MSHSERRDHIAATAPRGGRRYWKSLDDLVGSSDALARLAEERKAHAERLNDPASRREFLRLMGASLALAGATACTRQPKETIVPYVRAPENLVPGKPLFFATALTLGGFAEGVLVESHEGRPTKIEGNPSHPASLGASSAMGQAAILGLYDPDRSQTPRHEGEIQTWRAALDALRGVAARARAKRGEGLRILTGTVTSPTLAALIDRFIEEMPEARWVQFDSLTRDAARQGAVLAFGRHVNTRLRVSQADVILSLDSDFLTSGPGHLRHAREFAQRRRVGLEPGEMNRLYAAESSPTLTGAAADHRLALRPSEIEGFARAVASGLGMPVETPSAFGPSSAHGPFIWATVRDLRRHPGTSLVTVGDSVPAEVHALVHAINRQLGSVGKTVVYTDPIEARPSDQLAGLHELGREMSDGRVETILILGTNPVYDAPADVAFGDRLAQVPIRIHLGLHEDETAAACQWHLSEAHVLESWGDARAEDGTVTFQQPLIAPLYGGRSALEVLSVMTGDGTERSGHDLVREHWKAERGEEGFEAFWRRSLHDGVVTGSALPELSLGLRGGDWARSVARPVGVEGLEVAFRADAAVYDGRFANNGWLQELPRPLTKLTWDNAALVGPATALAQGVLSGDVVRVAHKARTVKLPVWVLPGHPEGVVTLQLGYGRTRAGQVGSGVGSDVGVVRTSDAWWSGTGAGIEKTGERSALACTQDHWSMEGREIVRLGTLDEYRQDPHFAQHVDETPSAEASLLTPYKYEGHAWGMAIDLSACTGCNACVVACQSENNIPVVGKDQVSRGREMQWIRIDRYYEGSPHDPTAVHQPVPCMQCEDAPCEVVCPVGATVHSDEGLNDQVYNRCVGTRYCSNNCPYKVRRFNFYLYQDWTTPTFKAMRNPDVTVRSRGVMEKCTYCVQRINEARITAQDAGREIRDGDIRTACQAVCPSQAIIFGDINDPQSQVSRWKDQPRNYALLAELGTRPRTTYLASVRNPNPEIAQAQAAARKG